MQSRTRGIALLAVLGVAACNRTPAPPPLAKIDASTQTDSIPVSGVGPEVVSVFRMVRAEGGVRTALDSLKSMTARDHELEARGHELAHALGRFAMGERRDLAVLRECTPIFQSGCFHGALEGWFLQGGTVDARTVRGVCGARPERGRPGFETLECWHGLGHGMMVRFDGDISQGLPLCDRLQTATAQRECADGIFMERAIRAVGAQPINVGTGPAMRAPGDHAAHGGGHAHGGHGDAQASSSSAAPLSQKELAELCRTVDARYQPSCWAYQPVALFEIYGVDPQPVLRACDQAPAAAVRDCYRGFGKQYLGAVDGDSPRMIEGCQQGNLAYAADCMLGGVEFFTDLEWTIEPGIAFCGQVPADAKSRCYTLIGTRLGFIHPDRRDAEAACRRVEAAYVSACLAGTRES